MIERRFGRWVYPLLLGSVAAAAAPVTEADPLLERAARPGPGAGPRVLALYHGWYGTPAVSRQWLRYGPVDEAGKRIVGHVNYPAGGPYDSTDPVVLERHCRQAKAAGVDTLVCSWWGKGDQTDRNFRLLLPLAARHGLTLAPLYEHCPQLGNPAPVLADFRAFLTEHARSPGFLKVGGRPVFFLFGRVRHELAPERWAEVLATLEKEHPPGVLAVVDGAGLDDALVFDGLFLFDPRRVYQGRDAAGAGNVFYTAHRPLLDRAARFRRLAVVTVTPAREEGERRDVAFYRAQWQSALRQKGAWVFVNSFNLWPAGTEIEPSEEYGDLYLRTTAQLAAEYRKFQAAS